MASVKTWGERLFYEEELHGRKGKQSKSQPLKLRNAKAGSSSKSGRGGGGGRSANFYRERLTALVENHPQVTVKITGGNKSLAGFVAHVNYISHHGEDELETEDGEVIQGEMTAEELQALWGGDLSTAATGENKYRENFHIVFSMPPGTDRARFGTAARETVRELFADNHRFLMAEHSNTEHPHLHVVVKAVGEDGRRLNPKKADLRHWREVFASNLRRHGIKAEATSRQIRGRFEKSMKGKVEQMRRNGRIPRSQSEWEADIADRVKSGQPYQHSKAVAKAKNTRVVVRGIYQGMIKDLEKSEYDADKELAMKLRRFLAEMPRINPREKVVYEEHRQRLEQAKALRRELAEQGRVQAQPEQKQTAKRKDGGEPEIKPKQ